MVPVGGEETSPVIETARETYWREKRENEDLEHQAFQAELTQVNKTFDAFAQRARIANKFDSMYYVNPGHPDDLMEVVIVSYQDKKYYQPMVYIKKTADDESPSQAIITTDGSLHFFNFSDGSLRTISEPDKNGNRHPLIPGIDHDKKMIAFDDRISLGRRIELDNGKELLIGKTGLKSENSRGLKNINEELTRTAGLAKKLVTGEAVPQS